MPLFLYECSDCGAVFEKFIVSDDNKTQVKCKNCGADHTKRRINKPQKADMWRGANDHMENIILPEVDRLQRELSSGNDSVFLDIAGDE